MTARQPHMLFVKVNCEIRSEANLREHYFTKHRRVKAQHEAVQWALAKHKPPEKPSGVTVTFTRVGGRRLDNDNLSGGFKAVRDAVARWIGIDDGSNVYRWVYNQRSQPKERFAELTITWDEAE
jgi:hypothetical protein